MLCYSPEGIEFDKEPIDAKECVTHCGYTLTKGKQIEALPQAEAIPEKVEEVMPQEVKEVKRGRPFKG